MAHGELVDADEGGCGDVEGFVLDTVVSFVDKRREEGGAIGTGDAAGRSEVISYDSRREEDTKLDILDRELSFVDGDADEGLGDVPVLLKNFLLTLIALNFLAVGAIVPVSGGVDVLEDGDSGRRELWV